MSDTTKKSSLRTETLNIAGWSKLSTVDWPEKLVTTVFLQGCPWKCNYCHNWEIIDPRTKGDVSWENDVLPHLNKRQGLLDGIVFSGGEPTMQGDLLIVAMKQAKDLGFQIGLHTGGAYPETIRKAIPLLDWVGFDVKAPWAKYSQITNLSASDLPAKKSMQLLLDSDVEVQYRTTVDPTTLSESDVEWLKNYVQDASGQELVIQTVRSLGSPVGYAEKLSTILNK